MPLWPGSPEVVVDQLTTIGKDGVNGTSFSVDSHVGTHIDAPLHFLGNGDPIDRMRLENLLGPAQVVYLPNADEISVQELESAAIAEDVIRVLFRTRNSELWEREVREFQTDYVALTADAAGWLVERGISLVGVDYLSIGRYQADGRKTHQILLEAGVTAVEGLNLARVSPGAYEFICLPLRLVGLEASPARAVLMTIE